MKLTKFKHSCFMLETNDQALVFDPGSWSTDLVVPSNAAAIVLTHEHDDHFNQDLLQSIIDKNPGATIVAPHQMAEKLAGFTVQGVAPGDSVTVGVFTMQFFG